MFVIRNKQTQEYITKNYWSDGTSDLNKARTFVSKNCGGYLTQTDKSYNDYEILEVEIKLK